MKYDEEYNSGGAITEDGGEHDIEKHDGLKPALECFIRRMD